MTKFFPYHYISDSNQIISLLIAVSSFMLFKNVKIPQSQIINVLGASTFGVLLIHANNDVMRTWLWKDVIDCVGHYHTSYNEIYMVLSVTTIFIACTLIDYIRKRFIENKLISLAYKGVKEIKELNIIEKLKNIL